MILDYLASKTISKDLVVVSPDVGGVVRARAFAKKLSDAPLAIVDKRRQGHYLSEVRIDLFVVYLFNFFISSICITQLHAHVSVLVLLLLQHSVKHVS